MSKLVNTENLKAGLLGSTSLMSELYFIFRAATTVDKRRQAEPVDIENPYRVRDVENFVLKIFDNGENTERDLANSAISIVSRVQRRTGVNCS